MENSSTKKNMNSISYIKELDDKTQENTKLLMNLEKKESKINEISSKDSNGLKYGNNLVLMYLYDEPFIVIGPHCMNLINLNFLKFIKIKKGPILFVY